MLQHALLTPHSPLEKTPHKAAVEGDGRVTAVRTAIEMAAQSRRTAAPYGAQYFQVLVTKPGTVPFYKAITVGAE
jgi:hypothetical protein